MARIVYIRNPAQPDDCLSGAMAEYIRRIPPRFARFSVAVAYLSRAKFEADDGKSGDDSRCFPAQRARIWPSTFNCWEATAHAAAEGARLLPAGWTIRIHDQNFGAYRHVWATLELPGLLGPFRPAANVSTEDVLGVLHTGGKVALSVFGAGAVGDALEGLASDALPDWAKAPSRRRPKEADVDANEPEEKRSLIRTKKKESDSEPKRTERATTKDEPSTSGGNGINDPI